MHTAFPEHPCVIKFWLAGMESGKSAAAFRLHPQKMYVQMSSLSCPNIGVCCLCSHNSRVIICTCAIWVQNWGISVLFTFWWCKGLEIMFSLRSF